MKLIKYFIIYIILLVCLGIRLDRYFFKKNDSFCPKFIQPNWRYCPKNETLPLSERIKEIFDQPFTYLAKGKQSFVFKSEDQQWVIKFIRLPRYARSFSLKRSEKSSYLTRTLQSCKESYENLGKETQVAYAHLEPSSSLNKKIHLIDRYQKSYFLELDSFPFAVQKYGRSFFSVFYESDKKKKLIKKTIQLYSKLYEKGYIDRDPILDKNFGIIGNEPFILDIGQLEKCEKLPSKADYLWQMTQSLGWKLQCEFPHLYSYYKNLLQ